MKRVLLRFSFFEILFLNLGPVGLYFWGRFCNFAILGVLAIKIFLNDKSTVLFDAFTIGDLTSSLTIFLSIVLAINTALNWFEESKRLTKIEHTAVFLIFAIYISVLFGGLKYQIYTTDSNAYVLNDEIKNYIITERVERYHSRIKEEQSKFNFYSGIIQDITATEGVFSKEGLFKKTFSTNHYTFEINRPVEDQGAPAFYRMTINPNRENITLTLGAIEEVLRSNEPKQALLNVIESNRENTESKIKSLTKRLSDIREHPEKYDISMMYFLYDSGMNIIGGSANYFTPKGDMGRFVQFFEALFKYLYFGIFIVIIVERSGSSTQKE